MLAITLTITFTETGCRELQGSSPTPALPRTPHLHQLLAQLSNQSPSALPTPAHLSSCHSSLPCEPFHTLFYLSSIFDSLLYFSLNMSDALLKIKLISLITINSYKDHCDTNYFNFFGKVLSSSEYNICQRCTTGHSAILKL